MEEKKVSKEAFNLRSKQPRSKIDDQVRHAQKYKQKFNIQQEANKNYVQQLPFQGLTDNLQFDDNNSNFEYENVENQQNFWSLKEEPQKNSNTQDKKIVQRGRSDIFEDVEEEEDEDQQSQQLSVIQKGEILPRIKEIANKSEKSSLLGNVANKIKSIFSSSKKEKLKHSVTPKKQQTNSTNDYTFKNSRSFQQNLEQNESIKDSNEESFQIQEVDSPLKKISIQDNEQLRRQQSNSRERTRNKNTYLAPFQSSNVSKQSQDKHMQLQPILRRRRQMKDIESGSMHTSHSIKQGSFKWSKDSKQYFSKEILEQVVSQQKKVVNQQQKLDEVKFGIKNKEQIMYEDEEGSMEKKEDFEEVKFEIKNKKMMMYEDEEESMENMEDFEEEVGELEIQSKRMRYLNFRDEDDLTQKKGKQFLSNSRKFKSKQDESTLILCDIWDSLEKEGRNDIISRASSLSKMLDIFISISDEVQTIVKDQDFHYCCDIGKGSFGQVDLYVLNLTKPDLLYSTITSAPTNSTGVSFSAYSSLKLSNLHNSQSRQFSVSRQIFSLEQQGGMEIESQGKQNPQLSSNNNLNLQSTQDQNQLMNLPLVKSLEVSKQISVKSKINRFFPVAVKTIQKREEFERELFIMQKIKGEFIPALFHKDLKGQRLFMELGLLSLEELKYESEDSNYQFQDSFTFSILIHLIKAIEQLLSYTDKQTNVSTPMFHSDLKPSNVMLSIKKLPQSDECQIKLTIIDYGGASFDADDYWTYFSPAFVCPTLWSKLVDGEHQNIHLSWEQIRYAEIYAACRTVQFLISDTRQKELFDKNNFYLFFKKYNEQYPNTCSILKTIYQRESVPSISNIFTDIFPKSRASLIYSPPSINFDPERLFTLSTFFTHFSKESISI